MAEIISYSDLVRQHQLSLLEHKRREYREREDYLARLRRLLFQIEGQMRQAEIQQFQVFKDLAEGLKIPLVFPDLGDRIGLHELFDTEPVLQILKEFLAERLSAKECLKRLLGLSQEGNDPQEA